jgi:4-hydroxy-3-polyprenylbenzoate decarboxylase
MKKLVIGISGSSGSIYAHRLIHKLENLRPQWARIGIVISSNALINWQIELNSSFNLPDGMELYQSGDFNAPFASGSARFETMIICPCSMGTMSRVATGISNDLMTRAADVMLKERRKLIIVPRETPLSLIHLRHMVSLTEGGAVILPAVPSFYHRPDTIQAVVDTVVDRILDHAGFEADILRWGD